MNAIESDNWLHLGCFAHTLQLGVKRVVQVAQVSKTFGRGRYLVSHFHHTSKSSYVLKQKQRDLHFDDLNLVQDVVTCWNSSCYMVERIIQLQQQLCAALIEIRRTDLMPTDTEISTMEIFIEVL